MPLVIDAAHTSAAGPRPANEDYCGVAIPSADELATKGALFAVADGVSGHQGAREASETTVRGLLSDYYATPDTWSVPQAIDTVLYANNRWLIAQTQAGGELAGMATTLSALVLRGSRYYVGHVGDSRVYLLRSGRLQKLTTDHVWDRPDMRHVLTRAVGLSPRLIVDYSEDALQEGDVFVLVSDGAWEPLGEARIRTIATESAGHPKEAARTLVDAALTRGGQDNASAIVVRVKSIERGDFNETMREAQALLPPPKLKPGQHVDRFEVLELLHESRSTLLYKVRDASDDKGGGAASVLKTLPPTSGSDAAACAALLAEEWLARRVSSHYFPQVATLAPGERTALYYVMSYHEGATLEQRLESGSHFTVADAVTIGIRILKGIGALHRLNVLHRDIKPANLHLGADGKLRILDLGVALNRGSAVDHGEAASPGTPSYIAPEQFSGSPADAQCDLYAVGVSLYHLLTRKYPYGEIEPFQHPRFGDPVTPVRHRPDIPRWLEAVLLKAVARDPKLRFETAEEFRFALERGPEKPLEVPGPTPLAARHPQLFSNSVAAVSIVVNLILLYLLWAR
jgi:protein phosphatase